MMQQIEDKIKDHRYKPTIKRYVLMILLGLYCITAEKCIHVQSLPMVYYAQTPGMVKAVLLF